MASDISCIENVWRTTKHVSTHIFSVQCTISNNTTFSLFPVSYKPFIKYLQLCNTPVCNFCTYIYVNSSGLHSKPTTSTADTQTHFYINGYWRGSVTFGWFIHYHNIIRICTQSAQDSMIKLQYFCTNIKFKTILTPANQCAVTTMTKCTRVLSTDHMNALNGQLEPSTESHNTVLLMEVSL